VLQVHRWLSVAAGIIAAFAVVAAVYGIVRLSAGSDPEGTFEGQIQWANVSLDFPPGSPFFVLRNPPLSPEHNSWELIVYVEAVSAPYPQLVIDGETGKILETRFRGNIPLKSRIYLRPWSSILDCRRSGRLWMVHHLHQRQ